MAFQALHGFVEAVTPDREGMANAHRTAQLVIGGPRGIFLEPGDGVTATIADLGSLDVTIEAPK